jgi:hypothetical protein
MRIIERVAPGPISKTFFNPFLDAHLRGTQSKA